MKPTSIDFARLRYKDSWIQHMVLGGPSWDNFEHAKDNPIYVGTKTHKWPVNGFLFIDPVSKTHYVYVGAYGEGYLTPMSHCRLLRQDGASWTDLGIVLKGNPGFFDKDGHTPDVSVVYDAGKYHMIYDWGTENFNVDGGIAYASAVHPEGPWIRDLAPITHNMELKPLIGRYKRTYAATLIKRRNDWMIVGMMDRAPWGWALFAMTGPKPQGPYSERQLMLHPEQSTFHPPLAEFYPAYTQGGWLICPSTSVALNRNTGCIFRAKLEHAHRPDAWVIEQAGSVWHADDVSNEHSGIWGQTYSGAVDGDGRLHAMFPSRTANGTGTINMASRTTLALNKDDGFVVSGHAGPTLAILRQTVEHGTLRLRYTLRGSAQFLPSFQDAIGPAQPSADSTFEVTASSLHNAVHLKPGTHTVTFEYSTQTGVEGLAVGALFVDKSSHLHVSEMHVTGVFKPALLRYSAMDGVLGHAENPAEWVISKLSGGETMVRANTVGQRIKFNVTGRQVVLLFKNVSARSRASIYVDGVRVPVALSSRVSVIAKTEGRHAVIVEFGDLELGCVGLLVTATESKHP